MKQYWRGLAERLDARSQRERMLVFLAAIALVLGAWISLVLTPWESRSKAANKELAAVEAEVKALDARRLLILARAQQDPDRPLRAQEQELGTRLEAVDQAIRERAGDFIPPDQMGRLLEDLLQAQQGLKLLRLETLPPEPIRLGDDPQAVAPVYRHGLVLEFSGDYAATLRFLQSVEAMPWRFFWDRLEYQVDAHPQAKVSLRIHTLSTQESAIGV